jgi:hypothetical protein
MGVHSTRAPEAWARDVLARYRTSLIGHEEVQLLCASVSTIEEAESIRPELINAIEKHTAEMISHTSEKSALRYGGERPFDILKPLFSQLCRNARSLYINELLGAWYGVAEPRRKRGIVFIASDSDGTHWFDDHVAIKSPLSDSRDELLKRLTSCMNEFLGTTVTVAGERDVSMNVPLRPGVPSEGNAEKLHEAMRDSYGLGSDELAGATFNGNNAMLVIPHTMVPIQAALCVATGRTFPIAASMQEPAADRTVKRVVLWMGGTFTDEIEIAAVTALFNAAGIVVENVSGAARTKERFLELYGSDGPDVIWITAHCEYDHFQPHKVSIGIAPGQFVSLSELEAVKVPGQGRRLLVLNICDGATGAVLGGVLGLGLGQLIAGCHQAVISHMWPVDQRISPAFGALLACELSRFASFFDAYSNSVKSIAAGKERLIETICAMPADLSQLVDRISSREFESSNIYFYGSPVFLE